MQLNIFDEAAQSGYKSPSQIARVLTERWFKTEMYCPCCINESIYAYPNNKEGYDFVCRNCNNDFQAKSSKKSFRKRIVDGEFHAMLRVIRSDSVPNLFCMHYSAEEWIVKDLFMIPKFFLSPSCVERRKPLSPTARRAGWVGCNILLGNIPESGKISVVKDEKIVDREKVRANYKRIEFLKFEDVSSRGWTSDVLNCVESLKKEEFVLSDVYSFEDRLKELHPDNKHVKAKIRQQLQLLRDRKILSFDFPGHYSLIR